jgi:hypothetical protein
MADERNNYIVVVLCGLALGFGLLIFRALHPSLVMPMPRSQWFYLCLLLALLSAVLWIIPWKDTLGSPSFMVLFSCLLPVAVVLLATLFLFFRLDEERKKAIDAQGIAVQDYRIHPTGGNQQVNFIPVGSLYQLAFSYPKAIFLNEDGQIELKSVYLSPMILDALKPVLEQDLPPQIGGVLPDNVRRSLKLQEIDASLELASQSFLIVPAGPVKFPLVGGTKLSFIITPKELGLRKVLVRSKLGSDFLKALEKVAGFDQQDTTITIDVLPERSILGLTGLQLQQIQIITSSVGLPLLAVTAVTLWWEARRDRRKRRLRQQRKK